MSDFLEYDHFSKVPKGAWPWKHFSPRELACKGTGRIKIHKPTMNKLEVVRRILGVPMYITSAYRSPSHNAAVGGAKNSQHLQGRAFDVRLDNINPHNLEAAARQAGFSGFGFYRSQNFIHIDTGPDRSWGKRWWTPGERGVVTEAPAAAPSPMRDKGVQGVGLASAGVAIQQVASASGGFLDGLHPNAQLFALGIAGVLVGAALYLGWGKLKAMLR